MQQRGEDTPRLSQLITASQETEIFHNHYAYRGLCYFIMGVEKLPGDYVLCFEALKFPNVNVSFMLSIYVLVYYKVYRDFVVY